MATATTPRRSTSRSRSANGRDTTATARAASSGLAKKALTAASTADDAGPGKLSVLRALWRVGRLAWQTTHGKRPGAKQLRKAASSATEVGAEALAAKAPGTKALAAKAVSGRALKPKARAKSSKAPSRPLAETLRQVSAQEFPEHVRKAPIQLSIDVAVPLRVAYYEWMKLESLPEGAHVVVDIDREDGKLVGRIDGLGEAREWEAEIRDERPDESFAWRSTRGSDVAALITFHRLAERLTRLEMQLDVVPASVTEAASLALRIADRRAETELRRFKLRVEMINPDAYPAALKRGKRNTSKLTKEN